MATVWLTRGDCGLDSFPSVCLRCGRPATERVLKTFSYMPPLALATLLLHPLVFFVVGVITRRTQITRVPLCRDHLGHWRWRVFAALGGLVPLGGAIVGLAFLIAAAPANSALKALAIAAIPGVVVLWLVGAGVLGLTAIRATAISEQGMRLSGVSEEFVEAYLEHRRHHLPAPPDLDRAISEGWADRNAAHDPPANERHVRPERLANEA